MQRRVYFYFLFFFEVVLNQENLDNQTQYHPQQIFCNLKSLYERYKQIHTRGSLGLHLSSIHIPHDLWTLHAEGLYTNA